MKAPRLKFPYWKQLARLTTISSMLLLAMLAQSCALTGTRPAYSPSLPALQVEPMHGKCNIQDPKHKNEVTEMPCILMLEAEWVQVVTELRAMCLALGHDEKTCGVTTKVGK